MSEEATVVLPVSLGEALDKLTILDIKLQKIRDAARRQDVKKEYDVLYSSLQKYVSSYSYHYRILLAINLSIWETQDLFHGKDTTLEEGAKLCRRILVENDRRFRVKAKINALANSALREQKGYAAKRAFFYGHLGLGDAFWMNGAVRYLATEYDEVVVVCKERNAANVAAMYSDDSSIKLAIVKDDADLHPWPAKREYLKGQGFTVYGCGFFSERDGGPQIYDLPNCFYDDIGIDRAIRRTYFHVPRTAAAASLLTAVRAALPTPYTPFIVVHQQSSVKTLPIVQGLLARGEARPILDLNANPYAPDHPFYAAAELVVNKPLLDYIDLLEAAAELHMIESSLYCLATHLDLSRVSKKLCYEPWDGQPAERLGVFETGRLSTPL